MKIAKEFRWEMGHRLPKHEGLCKNLHGHSYKMIVEFTGEPMEDGIVLDYYDVAEIVKPLVDQLDHSFAVDENDAELLEHLIALNSRRVVFKFDTTAENLCIYFLDKIQSAGLPENISSVKVRVLETENTYAEDERDVVNK